ncbi:Hypothetical protein CAP_6954 [Chondromyces apiculatus DSM 436]|uniref:Outer membrane protein beta-barrel domain-containing protein n=1 Tax=Chondromyces apiculatus DSM 436 TaxID=1192034 RepID=A0A017TG87_9BACT|nr:Hypothetical protein CAP_6954 [Chondromyces apiculatus DSM 436]
MVGLVMAAAQLTSSTARAQTPPPPDSTDATGAAPADDEEGPEAGVKRPPAPDQRAGHVLLQPRISLAVPFADLAVDLPANVVVGAGVAFGVNAGVGLGRSAVLQATGNYALLPGSARCNDCSGQSLDLGLGLAYHLTQGLAFDPWISYAVGYRRSSFEGQAQTSRLAFNGGVFQGIDAARIALGGDFYPLPWLGFGLFLGLDVGTYVVRPEGLGRSTYGNFTAGFQIALDPIRQRLEAPTRTGNGAQKATGMRSAPAGGATGLDLQAESRRSFAGI